MTRMQRQPQIHQNSLTVLLEYFAGEKPLRMSQSANNLTLCDLTIAFWQGLCVFTSDNLGFADFIVAN